MFRLHCWNNLMIYLNWSGVSVEDSPSMHWATAGLFWFRPGPGLFLLVLPLDVNSVSVYLTAAVLHVSTGRRCSRSCCPAGAASRCTTRSCCTRAAASSSTPTARPRPSPKPPETIPSCSWAASPSPPWAWSLKTVRSFLLLFFCLMTRVRRVSVWTPGSFNDLNTFVSTASPPKVQPRYDLDLDASYAKVLT